MKTIQSSLRRAIYTALFCLLVFNLRMGHAQQDSGAITGVVQDNAGAVIPDADVTLINTDNGLVLKTKANASGIYTFSPIKIGNYTVSASYQGFETTTQQNIHLDLQENLSIPVKLTPGTVSQTVTVTTQAAEKLALNFSLAVLFSRLGFACVCVVLAEMRWTGSAVLM